MPDPDELRAFVERYCAAVTAHEVGPWLALFTEDAVQRDPASSPPHRGHEAIAAFMAAAVGASEATEFTATDVHTSGRHVAFRFTVVVSLGGGSMTISGIETFEMSDDLRIRAATAYWDDRDVTVDPG